MKKYLLNISVILFFFMETGCSSFFYYPDNKNYLPPEDYNIKYTDYTIESANHINLHVRWFPAEGKNSRGCIVQFHGNAENLSSHYVSLIWLINAGYDLITFDYRGYGNSGGKPEPLGIRKDAISVIQFVFKMIEGTNKGEKIFLYGQSIGGAILLDALINLKENPGVSGLILESTFDSYRDIAIQKLSETWYTWIFIPFAAIIVADITSPSGKLNNLLPGVPKLVLHGNNDRIIPEKNGLHLYKELSEPKKYIHINGGRHLNTYFIENGIYKKELLDFLLTAETVKPR